MGRGPRREELIFSLVLTQIMFKSVLATKKKAPAPRECIKITFAPEKSPKDLQEFCASSDATSYMSYLHICYLVASMISIFDFHALKLGDEYDHTKCRQSAEEELHQTIVGYKFSKQNSGKHCETCEASWAAALRYCPPLKDFLVISRGTEDLSQNTHYETTYTATRNATAGLRADVKETSQKLNEVSATQSLNMELDLKHHEDQMNELKELRAQMPTKDEYLQIAKEAAKEAAMEATMLRLAAEKEDHVPVSEQASECGDHQLLPEPEQPTEIKPVQIPSPFLQEARKMKATLDESRDTSPLEEEEKKEKAAALKTPKPGPTGSKQPEPTPTFSDDGGGAVETPVKSSLDAPQQTVGVYGGFKKFAKQTLMQFTKEHYSPQACAEARAAASPAGTYNAKGELLEEPKTKLKAFTESVPAQGANKSKPSA